MKILYYATAYHAAHGGSHHAKAFVNECRKSGLVTEVKVFPEGSVTHPMEGSKRRVLRFLKTNPVIQPLLFWRRNTFHMVALRATVRKFKPDVIHIRLDSNFLQIKRLKRWFPGVIITTEINASPFDESFKDIALRGMFRRLERKSLAAADFNFFVSSHLRERVMKGRLQKDRDFVVHNGVDPLLFHPAGHRADLRHKYGLSDKDLALGYIGTLDAHKQVGILLESFRNILPHYPNARLFIIGDGAELLSLKRLAVQLAVDHVTNFTGLCPHSEIPAYINCLDVAIHHKAGEYMSPLKLFEYMACHVAVIGPGTSAVKEVFEDGVHLLLCDGSVNNLTNKVLALLEDPVLREKIAVNGGKLVTEKYTWAKNAEFILSLMKRKTERLLSRPENFAGRS